MLVDTNILLRYLLQDYPDTLSKQATDFLDRQPAASCIVPALVVAEIVYALLGKKYPRRDLAIAITSLLNQDQFVADEPGVIQSALSIFAETKLDFPDCYLAARSLMTGLGLKTFDKALAKLAKV